jgi:hypothetical protein
VDRVLVLDLLDEVSGRRVDGVVHRAERDGDGGDDEGEGRVGELRERALLATAGRHGARRPLLLLLLLRLLLLPTSCEPVWACGC